jgi:hypothetical protein
MRSIIFISRRQGSTPFGGRSVDEGGQEVLSSYVFPFFFLCIYGLGKKRERDAPSTYWPMTTPLGNIDNKPRDLAAEVRVQWDANG